MGELPGQHEVSVHLARFAELEEVADDAAADARWDRLLALREVVYRQLEALRQDARIGKSEEARVRLSGELSRLDDDLEATGIGIAELLIVSAVTREGDTGDEVAGYPALRVATEPFEAPTCARCWRRYPALVADPELPDLCERCHDVVTRLLAEGRAELG